MSYGDRHLAMKAACRADVVAILTSELLPSPLDRQSALYGYADEIGATDDPEFDPAWKPAGCR